MPDALKEALESEDESENSQLYASDDDEKRARRLAKSAAKAVKRQEDAQVAGYSNQDNPWNDPNLAESFVWGKKTDKDRARGVEELSKDGHKRKKVEMQVELEKVKRAREQREVDKEAYEEERRLQAPGAVQRRPAPRRPLSGMSLLDASSLLDDILGNDA